ncbi:MAG: pseudouridine-5'-phosphate glycosidase [Rhodospirillales bacterium]|nr:pseudouridine-5'-phosphate glycosidase [Rhodospirillales bacterium]
MDKIIDITSEIKDALATQKPIVALESTVISHGLPFPDNLAIARKMESVVRENGALPATIVVMDGKIKIGLSDDKLEEFAQARDVLKLSSRDLSYALSKRANGSTTVAATVVCAHKAGIKFFATGGIGGVHRGVDKTWDISADLQQLTQSPVAVICSGAKSILDLPKTLEHLETLCIPVVGYRTQKLPAFYSRESGLYLDQWVEGDKQAAHLAKLQWQLSPEKGILFANPVPQSAALDQEEIEKSINLALERAHAEGITGKAVTPYLLKSLSKLTDGASITTNKTLLADNARVAALIAAQYWAVKRES